MYGLIKVSFCSTSYFVHVRYATKQHTNVASTKCGSWLGLHNH